jgi:predicted esterase
MRSKIVSIFFVIFFTLPLDAFFQSRRSVSKKVSDVRRKELKVIVDHQLEGLRLSSCQTSPDVCVFFAHGYGNPSMTPRAAAIECRYREYLLPQKYTCAMYAPALNFSKRYVSFAQRYDVFQVAAHLLGFIDYCKKEFPGKKIICMGHSNGASTLLVALCKYPELAKQIDLLVLLAPYADVSLVSARKFVPKFLRYERVVRYGVKFVAAPNYSPSKKSPANYVKMNPLFRDLPVVMIHALDDRVIPVRNQDLLFNALKGADHEKIFKSKMSSGGHLLLEQNIPENDVALVRQQIADALG